MRHVIFSIALLLSFLWISSALADDNTCWLFAPQENDVWVIVYKADFEGNRDNIIWKGKIAAGEKIKIDSETGFIRYDYKSDPSQPYAGDISVECVEQQSFIID